jgi:hypothetical protein
MRMQAEWPLRLGCGCVNLYAGFFLLTDPVRFYTYVPGWLSHVANAVASVDTYLRLQGIGEIIIAVGLLGWFFPRWCVRLASTLLTVEMLLILLCVGVNAVTFRNIGILGAALALLLSSYQDSAGQATRYPLVEKFRLARRIRRDARSHKDHLWSMQVWPAMARRSTLLKLSLQN